MRYCAQICLTFLLFFSLQASFAAEKMKNGMIQSINLGTSWAASGKDEGIGLAEFRFGVSFGLPGPKFDWLGKSFFMISPNFSYTNVDWKGMGEFPDSLYSASVGITWMKPINEHWNIILNAGPGYAGDGNETHDSFRIPVMFAANWNPNKRWKVMLGAIYTDRRDLPFLPFGGFVYTPNDDWRFEFTAPTPRIARRFTAWSDKECERWIYCGGGFGGGNWAIESVNHEPDLAMYREFALLSGYEVMRENGFRWNFEIAYLFSRKMEFEHGTQPDYKPDNTLGLRLNVSF